MKLGFSTHRAKTFQGLAMLLALALCPALLVAQNMSINETGAEPDSSAMLDVSSTSKGFLMPRMTMAQRNAISNPAEGLMIYQTDSVKGNYIYYNSTWNNISGVSPASSGSITESNSGVAYLKDVKSSGTNGGTFISGTWQTRSLNTIEGDTTFVELNSNQFTLSSGVYLIDVNAPTGPVNRNKLRLRNITDNSDALVGQVAYAYTSSDNSYHSTFLTGALALGGTKTFELQHLCESTRATDGYGSAYSASGLSEVFSQIKIIRLEDFLANAGSSSVNPTPSLDSILLAGNDAAGQSIVNVDSLGIGTNDPDYPIHVLGTGTNAELMLETSGSNDASVWLRAPNMTWSLISTPGIGQFRIRNETYSLDYLNIDSLGHVGIGNTSPDSLLDVAGGARLERLNINSAYTFPSIDGTNGQVLTTDGSGNVSWAATVGDGDGIYDGSGSLSSNTTVTQGANTVAFTSTATNGFSVDGTTFSVDAANNRVGVGTSSPQGNLHLLGTPNPEIRVQASDTTEPMIRLMNTARTYSEYVSGSGALIFRDVSNNATRFRIDPSGQFGIGATTPSYKLDVDGTIRSGMPGTDGQLRIYSEQGATDYQVVLNPNAAMTQTTTYTLPADDGTASQVLTTNGSGTLSWAAPTGDGDGIYDGSGSLSGNTTVTQGANTIAFTSSATNAFNIDGGLFSVDAANNRIGIGTTTPSNLVDVFNTVTGTTPMVRIQNGHASGDASLAFLGGTTYYSIGSDASANLFSISNNSTGVGTNDRLVINSSGNIGIGTTSPGYRLDVQGAVRSGVAGTDGQLRIYSEQGATDYEAIFNPSASMTQNTTYTLPADDGNANEVLTTNGSGTLSWAAPTGDGNGIYDGSGSLSGNTTVSQAGNTLAFTSTASNAFSVDGTTFSVDAANNRVGIGTSAPSSDLHLLKTTGSSTFLIESQDTASAQVKFKNSEREYGIRVTPFGNLAFIDHSASSAAWRMRLDSVGQFSIGDQSPQYKLDVGGTIRTGWDGVDGQLRIYSEQGATDYQVVINPNAAMTQTTTYTLPPDNGNANDMLISDGSGNLSWGSSSAIGNGIYSGSGSLSGNTTVTQAANTLAFTTTATNGFSVDGSTFSVDAANARVGIGTTTPSQALHIRASAASTNLFLQSTSSLTTSGNDIGVIGFGENNLTTPQAQILVERDATSSSAADLPTRISFYTTPDASATLSERLRITNAGNVGIGITAPTEMLEVNGSIEIPAASEYQYASAKTQYYSTSQADISAASSTSTVYISATGQGRHLLGGTAGTNDFMFASVHLPNGAIVTGVDYTVLDNDATYDITAELVRVSHSAASLTSVSGSSLTTTSSNASVQILNATGLSHTIANENYAYYIRYTTRQANSSLRAYNALITYTVTAAD